MSLEILEIYRIICIILVAVGTLGGALLTIKIDNIKNDATKVQQKQLTEKIDGLQSKLQPFENLAGKMYPGIETDAALGKLYKELQDVKKEAQPRSISSEAAKLLIDNLAKVPAEKIELHCLMNDAETQNLSSLLKDVFTKANWSVVKELSIYPNKPIKNIVLGIPEQKKDSTAALILYNWFEQNGFKPTAELVKDSEVIIILVGSKS